MDECRFSQTHRASSAPLLLVAPVMVSAKWFGSSLWPITLDREYGRAMLEKIMRMARLELARLSPHAPQACVSTDSTTSA